MKTIALMAMIIAMTTGMAHAADVTFSGKADVQQYLSAKSSFFRDLHLNQRDTSNSVQAGNIIAAQDSVTVKDGTVTQTADFDQANVVQDHAPGSTQSINLIVGKNVDLKGGRIRQNVYAHDLTLTQTNSRDGIQAANAIVSGHYR